MVDVPEDLELTAPQARVLGALMEKEATTPDTYPMTLNALTTACNQTSNRQPVVSYDAQLVETTLFALKGKGLARFVHPGAGERSTKYRHVVDEALGLNRAAVAVMAVLLLRGPQTVAELKTRTARLYPFASTQEVQQTLSALATHPRTLVAELPRGAGQKEPRWMQLVEEGAEERAAVPAAGSSASTGGRSARIDELEARLEALESRLAALEEELDHNGPR